MHAVGLVGAEKRLLYFEQSALCVIDIDAGQPRQPVALSAGEGLQAKATVTIALGRLPGQVMLQEGHTVTAPVGPEGDLCIGAPVARESQISTSRPRISIGLRIGVFLPGIVILVGLKAPDIASGFLIEVAALE